MFDGHGTRTHCLQNIHCYHENPSQPGHECHVRNILIEGSPKELVGHFGTTKKFGAVGWDKKIPKFFFFLTFFCAPR